MTQNKTVPYLKIHPNDNVLVALQDLPSGTTFLLDNGELALPQDVHAKHKFYVHDMKEGDDVIMYGTLVGKAANKYSKRRFNDNGQYKTRRRFLCLHGI